jgi:short subunit dehydrogenase-like uncharacterized protein
MLSKAGASRGAREFDVVVYGGTGFTGRLVCEHLAREYSGRPAVPAKLVAADVAAGGAAAAATPAAPATTAAPAASPAPTLVPPTAPPVRWAMAGRDPAKLRAVASELAEKVWGDAALADNIPTLVADAKDDAALRSVAARTKVFISTAGPYAKYGDGPVAAAVAEKAHYADLTGEVLWARRVSERHHAEAAANGTKVVCMAGYDSCPSEIGAWLAADTLRREGGGKAASITTVIGPAKGGFSGGTIASGFHQSKAESKDEVKRSFQDPYYLCRGVVPFSGSSGESLLPPTVDKPAPNGPARTPHAARVAAFVAEASSKLPFKVTPPAPFLAPFVMSPINTRVVHRSEALWRTAKDPAAASPFSPNGLTYWEALGVPSYPAAAIVSAVGAGIGAMFAFSPLRALAERALPKPGEGPSREMLVGGFWQHVTFAVDESGKKMSACVVGDPNRDPGYFGTARMLLEVGLTMALDEDECARAGALPGGCLTPTTATGGAPLVKRLRGAGLQIETLGVTSLEE